MDSLRVNAWILAKMTKSSSALDSSRQFFKLNMVLSSDKIAENMNRPLDQEYIHSHLEEIS